jgi:sugar/nucleoside kinase (ribokinase family)
MSALLPLVLIFGGNFNAARGAVMFTDNAYLIANTRNDPLALQAYRNLQTREAARFR